MGYGIFTILVLLFTGFIKPVSAQQLIFKNYTVNDGLIANAILRVFQDSKGFLWIATWEGLSKYDGYKFTNYSTANGLSHNLVNDFYESADGRLYAATNGGSIDMVNENKIVQRAVPSTTTVNRFYHFPGGRVIVTTDKEGLQEFRDGKLIKPRQDFPLSSYFDFTVLSDSIFIVVGESAIRLLNRKYELLAETQDTNLIYTEFKIYQDRKKRVFIGTGTGLRMLAGIPKKNKPITFTLPPASFNIPALQRKKITHILEDADGITWVGTTRGLFKISPDGSYQLITKKDGLASDNITTIFQDREKNIWFGTLLGLSKLVTKSTILVYTAENGLWSNSLYFLYPVGKGHLLVSTQKGLQVFNTGNGKFDPVTNIIEPPFYRVVANSHPPLVISGNKMATFDTVTLQYDKAVPSPLLFSLSPYSNIISDKQGNFLLSDQLNLYFISEKKDQTEKILENLITVLLLDKKGYVWAGTWEKGLYRIQYSFNDQKLTILANEHFMPDENIRSLFEDSKGNIWVGTRYHGVYRFSKNGTATHIISNIDQSKGLTSNWVKAIAEDANGDLWIASLQGLDKLIQQDTSYRVFNFSRVNDYFGSISGMVTDKDHSLWLATDEGLVYITDGEMERSLPLPVYITKVSAPDSVYALNAAKLNLGYKHNQLQFEFSSPGFINEKQLLYSYRLSGSSSTKWSEASNQHTVSYASLQPGHYLFEVRTLGWNGNWDEPASFEFNIKPPFWQTWWFLVLCSLLFFAGIFWVVRRRVGMIRSKAAMKHKLAETEMAALRAQMNPHFIFNSLNSIENFIMQNEKRLASDYLNKFARLIRMILESSRNEVVPVTKDMEALTLYVELEQLRFNNKFSYHTYVDPQLLNGDYKVPSLLIQPYVENAIVHGIAHSDKNDLELTVTAALEGNIIKYTIQDNGIGRKLAAEYNRQNKPGHKSVGLKITEDRIAHFNLKQHVNNDIKITDLYNEERELSGTRVEVKIKAL